MLRKAETMGVPVKVFREAKRRKNERRAAKGKPVQVRQYLEPLKWSAPNSYSWNIPVQHDKA